MYKVSGVYKKHLCQVFDCIVYLYSFLVKEQKTTFFLDVQPNIFFENILELYQLDLYQNHYLENLFEDYLEQKSKLYRIENRTSKLTDYWADPRERYKGNKFFLM